jgi:Sulfotransferase domain
MRIVVIAPPRSGNHWIECLLRAMYNLHHFAAGAKPDAAKPRIVQEWAQSGFPDDSIFHLHCRYSSKLCDVFEAVPAHIVTIVRDPYDAFVSRYYWLQEIPTDRHGSERRPRHRMVGRPLDDPEVLAFLADPQGFGSHLTTAERWLHSGRALVVRYEELHDDPLAALTRLTEAIAPVDRTRIETAVEVCRAENMRQRAELHPWRVRTARIGDSKERLGQAHLAIFREHYADVIASLGYEVR